MRKLISVEYVSVYDPENLAKKILNKAKEFEQKGLSVEVTQPIYKVNSFCVFIYGFKEEERPKDIKTHSIIKSRFQKIRSK
jgi:hypothetical protein